MPPERLVPSEPQEHIPKATQPPSLGGLVEYLAKPPDEQSANTMAKATGFVAQRQGASDEQEVSASQSLGPPHVPTDPGHDDLRRQASDDGQDPGLEIQSKAAPTARHLLPADEDPEPDWGGQRRGAPRA